MEGRGDQPPIPSWSQKLRMKLREVFHKSEPAVPSGAKSKRPSAKEVEPSEQSHEDAVLNKVTIEKFVRSLNSQEQQVYELMFVEGKTAVEASRELGISDSRVGVVKHNIEVKYRRFTK